MPCGCRPTAALRTRVHMLTHGIDELAPYQNLQLFSVTPGGLVLHPDLNHLIYPLGSKVVIQQRNTKQQEFLCGHTNLVTAIDVSPDGKMIASGQLNHMGFTASVILWNFDKRQQVVKHELHKVRVESLAFSCDSKSLISLGGRDDSYVIVWDIENNEALCGSISNTGTSGDATVLCRSSHKPVLFFAAGMYNLRVWTIHRETRSLSAVDVAMGMIRRIVLCILVDSCDEFLYCGTTTGDIMKVKLNFSNEMTSNPVLVGCYAKFISIKKLTTTEPAERYRNEFGECSEEFWCAVTGCRRDSTSASSKQRWRLYCGWFGDGTVEVVREVAISMPSNTLRNPSEPHLRKGLYVDMWRMEGALLTPPSARHKGQSGSNYSRGKICQLPKIRYWAPENPNFLHETPQHFEKIGVWYTVSFSRIVATVFFDITVNTEVYGWKFNEFMEQLDKIEFWEGFFQQNSATFHMINFSFNDQVIAKDLWPPQSPDVSSPDFHLWGFLKKRKYMRNTNVGSKVTSMRWCGDLLLIGTALCEIYTIHKNSFEGKLFTTCHTDAVFSPIFKGLRLAHSPPSKANRVQSPAGSLPDFHKWESCWTMPLVGGFTLGSLVSPALAFQHCSILTSSSSLKTSLLRAAKNLSTQPNPIFNFKKYSLETEIENGNYPSNMENFLNAIHKQTPPRNIEQILHNSYIFNWTSPFKNNYTKKFLTSSKNDIRVWETKTSQELIRITVANFCCTCVQLTYDGKSIVSGWNDGSVRSFTPQTGRPIYHIHKAHGRGISALAVTKSGKNLVTGGCDGQVQVWRITPTAQTQLGVMKQHKGPVSSLQLSPDNNNVVSSSTDGTCIIWDIVRLIRLQTLFSNTQFMCACYIPSGSQVITVGTNRKIGYWEVFDGSLVREIEGSTSSSLNCVDISSDGQFIVTGGNDQIVKVSFCGFSSAHKRYGCDRPLGY
ncbi:hypothetical protein PR048_003574 [Dryococelus australis]|uniref:Cilia- and flagella-associated protein 52 n=1 Tax=Dryococelus australis TaxID=614101 RepID=A0ABQ9ING9_9NEOP|nr:hypothetical protein PR048_003574 [Dryococelus australis]